MISPEVLAKLIRVSNSDGVDVGYAITKLFEESGEFAAAALKHQNIPNASKSADDNMFEEGVDAIICILDVLNKTGHSLDGVGAMMDQKLDKWASKFE